MKFSYFFILFIILLALPTYAKVTEISTSCDLFDCVSYFSIDSDLSAIKGYIGTIDAKTSKYAYGDFQTHIGSLKDVKIEVIDKSTIKVSGQIEGSTNNLWGFSILGDASHLYSTWWNSSYQLRKNITVNKDYVKANVTNFPLLVKWDSDANLSKYAKSDGSDLVFTNDTNAKLVREIVYYNSATGQLVAWVNTSLRTDINTTIWLYYMNPSGAEGNSEAVWNGSYKMVQHLNGTAYDECLDSTSNNNDVTAEAGNGTYGNAGKIFRSLWCDGNGDVLTVSNSASLLFGGTGSSFTISFWTNRTAVESQKVILRKGRESGSIGWDIRSSTANIWGLGIAASGVDGIATSLNVWHFITIAYDGSNARFYYDGALATTAAFAGYNPDNTTANLGICGALNEASYYTGFVEEVRIENINRSAGWINTTYQTQNNPAGYTAATLGEQEYFEYLIGDPIYNATTTERNIESFYIWLSTRTNITNATAYLMRNGTAYNSSVVKTNYIDSNLFEFSNTFIIPYLSNSSFTEETVIFNWTFTITYFNGSQINITSGNYNQSIVTYYLSSCVGNLPLSLNFTIFNEENMTQLVNTTFKIYGTLEKDTSSKNFSFSFSGHSNYSLCIFPNTTMKINATIEYSASEENYTYSIRNYYLSNNKISNVLQGYKLYLLDSTYSKLVRFNIIDSSSLAVGGAFIKIQRYDYDNSAYITMTMVKTDDEGVGLTYLRGNDIFYKFVIEKDNSLLSDKSPTKIPIDPIEDDGELTLVADPTVLGSMYTYISVVSFGCSLNKTTKVLRCSLTDSTGNTQNVRLVVNKVTPRLRTEICDDTVTSTATTMTCNLAGYNGTFAYRFFAVFDDGREYTLDSGSFAFSKDIEWGITGVFMALLLFLTMSAVGIYRPEMSLILGGGAIVVASALNILALELTSGSIAGLIVVIAILIYRMRDKNG